MVHAFYGKPSVLETLGWTRSGPILKSFLRYELRLTSPKFKINKLLKILKKFSKKPLQVGPEVVQGGPDLV